MNNKLNIMRVALSIVFALCIVFTPLVSHAEYGDSTLFNGNLRVYTPDVVTFIDCVQVDSKNFIYYGTAGTGNIQDDYQKVKYAGSISGFLEVNGMTENHILNGYLLNMLKLSMTTIDTYTYSPMQVDFDFQYGGTDVVFSTALQGRGAGYYNSHIRADFNNYYCDKAVTRVPFTINVEFSIICPAGQAPNEYYRVTFSQGTDTTGVCYEYTDLRDVPSEDGFIADQNQQIIDGVGEIIGNQDLTNDNLEYIYNENIHINENITTQGDNIVESVDNMNTSIVTKITTSFTDLKNNLSTWFTGLNDKIDNRFDRLTNDLSNWFFQLGTTINSGFQNLINQNTTQHEETVNGYQGTDINDVQTELDTSLSDMNEAESYLFEESVWLTDEFANNAFNLDGLNQIGASLLYVGTWFSNFWNMGGLFSSILNISLAVFVAFYILRVKGR